MKERRIEHTYNCSEDVFWDRLFLDDEYNRKLFMEQLHFTTWRVLRSEPQGTTLYRVIEAAPPLGDLPSALKRILADGLGYEEHGVLDRQNRRYRVQAKPRSLASKLTIEGELTTEPLSERSCRRIYVARVDARVLGVGGMLEQRLLDELQRNYDQAAVFTNRWVAEHFPEA